jgi:hypothetical protein
MTWNGQTVTDELRRALAAGVHDAADHLRAESRKQVPTRGGTLRDSAEVADSDSDVESTVSYGTPYAVFQHEVLDLQHEQGNAKYLEKPFSSEHDAMRRIIAERARGATGG